MSEKVGSAYAELSLETSKVEAGADKADKAISSLEKKVSRAFDQLTKGPQRAQEAMEVWVKAVERAGGVSNLSAKSLETLTNKLGYLHRAGATIPDVFKGINLSASGASRALAAASAEIKTAAESAAGRLGPLGAVMASLGPAGLVTAAGIGAATVGIAALAKATMGAGAHGSELQALGTRLNMSVEGIQAVRVAVSDADIDFGEFTQAATLMEDALTSAPQKFRQLGLSVTELKGMKADEALLKTVAAIEQLGTKSEKIAAYRDIFGKTGAVLAQLGPVSKEAAASLGLVWSDKQAADADALDDTLGRLRLTSAGLWNNIGLGAARSPELVRALQDITIAAGDASRFFVKNTGVISGALDEMIDKYRLLDNIARRRPLDFGRTKETPLVGIFENGVNVRTGEVLPDAAPPDWELNPKKKKTYDPEADKKKQAAEKLAQGLAAIAAEEAKAQRAVSDEILNAIGVQRISVDVARQGLSVEERTLAAARERAEYHKQLIVLMQKEAAEAGATAAAIAEAEKKGHENALLDRALGGRQQRTGQYGEVLDYGLGTPEQQAATEAAIGNAKDLATYEDHIAQAAANAGKTTAEWRFEHHKLTDGVKDTAARLAILDTEAQKDLGNGKEATIEWSSALANLANQVEVLGSDSLTSVAGGVASIGAQVQSIKKLGNLGDMFGAGDKKMDVGKLLSGASSMLAMAGAAVKIGGALGDAFTKSGGEKAQGDVKRIVGLDVDEQRGDEINELAKRLGIGRTEAVLLQLADLAQEAERPLSDYQDRIIDLFNALGNGAVPARQATAALKEQLAALAEEGSLADSGTVIDRMLQAIGDGSIGAADGVEMLGTALASLAEAAEKGIDGARGELVDLILDSRAAGKEIEGLKEFTAEKLAGAGADLTTIFRGAVTGKTEEGKDIYSGGVLRGTAAGDLFGANLEALSGAEGLVAAIKELAPAWEEIRGTGAFAGQSAARDLMSLGSEKTLPLLEQLEALQRQAGGLGATGSMTAGSFAALQDAALAQRAQLEAAGGTREATLQAMGPLLAELQQSASDYGLVLSEGLQQTIADAQAAGVAFASDPQRELADAVQAQIAATEDATAATRELAEALARGVQINMAQLQQYHSGGYVPTDQIASLKAGEWVVPPGAAAASSITPAALREAIGGMVIQVESTTLLDGEVVARNTTRRQVANGQMMSDLSRGLTERGFNAG